MHQSTFCLPLVSWLWFQLSRTFCKVGTIYCSVLSSSVVLFVVFFSVTFGLKLLKMCAFFTVLPHF